jgi:ELWxxDGT repeat protein
LWFLATLLTVSLAGAQPMPVQDVFPQSYYNAVYNGSRHLWASSAATGNERWKSDLAGSTFELVKELVPGPGGTGSGLLFVLNGVLCFETNGVLYRSDGTAAGTLLLADLNPYYIYEPYGGPASSYPGNFQIVNGDLYFQAAVLVLPEENPNEGTTARASNSEMPETLGALFAVRGATRKLVRVFTSQPARWGIGARISSLTNVNGTLYFTTYSSWPTITPENKLYASEGTSTRLLKDFARTRWVRPSELRRRRFA